MQDFQNSGFLCVQCGGSTMVLESRSIHEGRCVRRRRECLDCKTRATTHELTIAEPGGQPLRSAIVDLLDMAKSADRIQARRDHAIALLAEVAELVKDPIGPEGTEGDRPVAVELPSQPDSDGDDHLWL